MTDPVDRLLRRALDEIADDAADPAGHVHALRRRATVIRRRRTTAAAGSLVVLAAAATLSASALAGVVPQRERGLPPAAPTPSRSLPAAPPASVTRVPSAAPVTGQPKTPAVRPDQTGQAPPPPVPATPASAVLDTIGVTVHLDRGHQDVLARLLAAGIRHVRTDAVPLYADRARCDDPYLLRRRALTDAGIRLTLTVGITANLAELRPTVDCLGGPRVIAAIEGQNEPDRYVGGDWVQQTREGQQALYRAVKNDRALAGIQVLAPTPSTSDALGSVAQYADLANAHPFQASYAQLPSASVRARTVAPGRPMVITDLGWSNAVLRPAGRSAAEPVSEQVAATELPRVLLDNVRRGILRTYVYSLTDERDDPSRTDLEAGFGLLRHDGTAKPAYAALSALTATLAGSATEDPATSAGQLAYRLAGDTEGVAQLLIGRADGSFVLAIWGNPRERDLLLTLASPARMRVLTPSRPTPGQASGPARHFDLTSDSAVTLIEIRT